MELLKILKSLKRMIWLERTIRYFVVGLCVGTLLSFAVLVLNKFVYIGFSMNSAVAICIATGGFFGILIGFSKFASYKEAAKLADSLGFKERFITALELNQKKPTTEMERLQIEDTMKMGAELTGLYKLALPIKELKNLTILCVLVFVAYFVPSPFEEQLMAQANHKAEISEQIETLEAKTAEQLKNLTKKDAAEINIQMRKIIAEMRNAKDKAESIKAMEKAQAELKKAANNNQSKEMKALAEKLLANEKTQEFGKALESGDLSELEKDMNDLARELENASPEDLKEISKLLEQSAKELQEDSELAKNLNELAKTIEADDTSNTKESLAKLSDTLADLAKQSENLQQALKQLQETVASTQNELSGQSMQGKGKEPQEGAKAASSGGSGTGEAGGFGRGTGHIENENIYARPASGMKDYSAEISGIETENGEMIEREQTVTGQVGELKPYDEVLNSYKEEALKELTEYEIPQGMRDLVKEYFSTLK